MKKSSSLKKNFSQRSLWVNYRSSAIFPFFIGKDEDTILVFQNYWIWKSDIKNIKGYAKRIGAEIITTEKDYVKISNEDRNSINFLEVALEIDNEEELIKFIKAKIYD